MNQAMVPREITKANEEVIFLGSELKRLVMERHQEGRLLLSFDAPPGRYQFSVIADATRFSWEELYFPLKDYGNNGDLTGPWDFDLSRNHQPLIPSYEIVLNGERIGLWNFQRVSLEDIENKRFRGRFAFQIKEAGQHQLELLPYRNFSIDWLSANLERDWEVEDWTPLRGQQSGAVPPWETLHEGLENSHALYKAPLLKAFSEVCANSSHTTNDLPTLIAAWKLSRQSEGLELALKNIDRIVALKHWGNPDPNGYGHDGDMEAALMIRSLAWAQEVIPTELGTERRQAILHKLALQGERFVTQALLTRDYWGGSLLQDHGWRSMLRFGTATLYLLDLLPEARRWEQFIMPRIFQAFKAMPPDGVIPASSYGNLDLYLHDLVPFRSALLARGGVDVLKQTRFQKIVDYIRTVMRGEGKVLTEVGIQKAFRVGGIAFLNTIASIEKDRRTAKLSRQILLSSVPNEAWGLVKPDIYRQGILFGLLSYDPSVVPMEESGTGSPLVHFEDSGLVHYYDEARDLTLAVRCGPLNGHNAYRFAKGPCDRADSVPGAGHFAVYLKGEELLCTPEFGYRMRSFQRSCLLIDQQGQYGDIGYPMAIPSKQYRGEEIESVSFDEQKKYGRIRLQLAQAYPDSAGLISYTREFLVGPDSVLRCRDAVLLAQPRRLSWLFHAQREKGIRLEGLTGVIGKTETLQIHPEPIDLCLRGSIAETGIVWSYASPSHRAPVDHLRYDSKEAVRHAVVDFVITPGSIGSSFPN